MLSPVPAPTSVPAGDSPAASDGPNSPAGTHARRRAANGVALEEVQSDSDQSTARPVAGPRWHHPDRSRATRWPVSRGASTSASRAEADGGHPPGRLRLDARRASASLVTVKAGRAAHCRTPRPCAAPELAYQLVGLRGRPVSFQSWPAGRPRPRRRGDHPVLLGGHRHRGHVGQSARRLDGERRASATIPPDPTPVPGGWRARPSRPTDRTRARGSRPCRPGSRSRSRPLGGRSIAATGHGASSADAEEQLDHELVEALVAVAPSAPAARCRPRRRRSRRWPQGRAGRCRGHGQLSRPWPRPAPRRSRGRRGSGAAFSRRIR